MVFRIIKINIRYLKNLNPFGVKNYEKVYQIQFDNFNKTSLNTIKGTVNIFFKGPSFEELNTRLKTLTLNSSSEQQRRDYEIS